MARLDRHGWMDNVGLVTGSGPLVLPRGDARIGSQGRRRRSGAAARLGSARPTEAARGGLLLCRFQRPEGRRRRSEVATTARSLSGGREGGSIGVSAVEWERVKSLTERSMFSALTALLYLVGISFRLEGYMGYLLPLPIILMGVRHGARSSWGTLGLIAVLMTVLFGPVRAMSFVCVHGLYSTVLATFWGKMSKKGQDVSSKGWLLIILVTAVSRVVGLIGSIFLISWLIGDNILALIFSGIENLFEQFFSVLGLPYLQFPLPTGLLAGTFIGLAIFTSCLYVALIYFMHASVVYKMGIKVPLPLYWKQRLERQRQAQLL